MSTSHTQTICMTEHLIFLNTTIFNCHQSQIVRDVTDSKSASESDSFSEIRNPTDTYNPITTDSKFWFRSNSNVIFVNNHCGYYSRNKVE